MLRLINWPGTLLILLTLTVFLLPPSSNERIVYGKRTRWWTSGNLEAFLSFYLRCSTAHGPIHSSGDLCIPCSQTIGINMAVDGANYILWYVRHQCFTGLLRFRSNASRQRTSFESQTTDENTQRMCFKRRFILLEWHRRFTLVYFWLSNKSSWLEAIRLCHVDCHSRQVLHSISRCTAIFLDLCFSVNMMRMTQQQTMQSWNH